MQADLKQIGIEVKIVSYDWGTYLEKSRLGGACHDPIGLDGRLYGPG